MDGLIEFPLLTGSGPQGNVLNGKEMRLMKLIEFLWNENTSRGRSGRSQQRKRNEISLICWAGERAAQFMNGICWFVFFLRCRRRLWGGHRPWLRQREENEDKKPTNGMNKWSRKKRIVNGVSAAKKAISLSWIKWVWWVKRDAALAERTKWRAKQPRCAVRQREPTTFNSINCGRSCEPSN